MLVNIGYFVIFLGAIAFLISAIGILRMPDLYTRMHVGTKSTTMGILLITFGTILVEPTWWAKLVLLVIFILLTNPLSSSVIARAFHTDDNTLELDELRDAK